MGPGGTGAPAVAGSGRPGPGRSPEGGREAGAGVEVEAEVVMEAEVAVEAEEEVEMGREGDVGVVDRGSGRSLGSPKGSLKECHGFDVRAFCSSSDFQKRELLRI